MSKLTIIEFLEARIAEDEGVARFALNKGAGLDVEDFESGDAYARNVLVIGRERILAECAAKRAIIHYCAGLGVGKRVDVKVDAQFRAALWIAVQLAKVYKDHPDYRQGWAL